MTKPKETTTFGLSSEKVARLLGIDAEKGQTETSPREVDVKAELLRDRLAETLSLHEVEGVSSRRQTQMIHTVANLAGKPIGTLLLDPSTDLAVIRRIKDHGRQLARSARSKPDRRVAHTIYYAAIAAALVFHHEKITSHAEKNLLDYFDRLAKEEWNPPGLADLFGRARSVSEGQPT